MALLFHVHGEGGEDGEGARPDAPQRSGERKSLLPFVGVRVVALHDVDHASIVPRISPYIAYEALLVAANWQEPHYRVMLTLIKL